VTAHDPERLSDRSKSTCYEDDKEITHDTFSVGIRVIEPHKGCGMTLNDPVILTIEYEGLSAKAMQDLRARYENELHFLSIYGTPQQQRQFFQHWLPGRNCKSKTMNSGGRAMPCASGATALATANTMASYGRTGSIHP